MEKHTHEPNQEQCREAARLAVEKIVGKMDDEGLTGAYLAKKLREELEAFETVPFKGEETEIKYTSGGRKRVLGRVVKNVVIYSDPLVAHEIRIKALDMAFKLRGDYAPEEKRFSGTAGGPIQFLQVEFVKPD
jgi:hypothetical protein